MPIARLIATALAALALGIGGKAASSAQTISTPAPTAPAQAQMPPAIEFYLAKGEANACGPGCSQWIAAEGTVNAGAAQRFRHLLGKLGRERPPIFFDSPGGSVSEALEIGRLIREQKLVTSLGRTVPLACTKDKASNKPCEVQKQAGQVVDSVLGTPAMCNSACVYALAGGFVRLVPPGVGLGVHDVGLDPKAAPQSKAVAAQTKRIAHEHIEEYLHDMGIDEGLYRAAAAIPFESGRFLGRDEMARFGIDKREFGESPWRFLDQPAPSVVKQFFARTDNNQVRYFDGLLILNCTGGNAIRLTLARSRAVAETGSSALDSISVSGQRINLTYTGTVRDMDFRSASLGAERAQRTLAGDAAAMQLSGTDLARADDTKGVSLDMHGFSETYAKLEKSCESTSDLMVTVTPSAKPEQFPLANKPLAAPALPGASMTPLDPFAPGAVRTAPTPLAPGPGQSGPPSGSSTIPPGPQSASAQSCEGKIPSEPQHVTGRVVAFLSDEEAQERTQRVEAALGIKVSAAYASSPRVNVVRSDDRGSTMAVIPENITVKLGDLVELNSRHRDQGLPCSFVPWTINRLIDRAQ